MKFCLYNITIPLLIVFLLIGTSCKKVKTKEEVLLGEAQLLLDDKPKEALSLLDSIANPATSLSKDKYMQYIVANTYARFTNDLDITHDTLIFKAITYFEKHNNEKQLAVAYLYAGNVYNLKDEKEKAFRLYTKSYDLAKKNDDLFTETKSYFNIGYYYSYNNITKRYATHKIPYNIQKPR